MVNTIGDGNLWSFFVGDTRQMKQICSLTKLLVYVFYIPRDGGVSSDKVETGIKKGDTKLQAGIWKIGSNAAISAHSPVNRTFVLGGEKTLCKI